MWIGAPDAAGATLQDDGGLCLQDDDATEWPVEKFRRQRGFQALSPPR